MRTETIIKEIYTFDELSESAKEAARQWWREHAFDYEWWDFVYEDAERVAEILGIEFNRKAACGRDSGPAIWFSGFWSQGDGACFDGRYSYAKGAAKAVRKYAPKDTELHRIADTLQIIQRRYFYRLGATCNHSGHYCHSGCMSVDVDHCDDSWRDVSDAESDIRDALRSFADWIYSQLETEFEYKNSDESVDESIRANECEFDIDGRDA